MARGNAGYEAGLAAEVLKPLGEPGLAEVARLFDARLAGELDDDDAWDEATVRLFPKAPGATAVADYRPIALQPILLKAYEACLARLARPVYDHIRPEQFGFRPGTRADYQTWTLRSLLAKASEHRQPVVVVKTDIRKAFDTVPHECLEEALCKRGVDPIVAKGLVREARRTRLAV